MVKGPCSITLHPSVDNPEFVLLSSSWNGTPYDEYVLLEFYTPASLNHLDATAREDGYRLPNKPGIKAYHVDARLGVYEKGSFVSTVLTESSILTGKLIPAGTGCLSDEQEEENLSSFSALESMKRVKAQYIEKRDRQDVTD